MFADSRPRSASVAATSEYFPLCVMGSSGTSTITAGTWAGDASRASAVRMRARSGGSNAWPGAVTTSSTIRESPVFPGVGCSTTIAAAISANDPSTRYSSAGPIRIPRTFIVPSERPCIRAVPRSVISIRSPCVQTPGCWEKYAAWNRSPAGSSWSPSGRDGNGVAQTSSPMPDSSASIARTSRPKLRHCASPA